MEELINYDGGRGIAIDDFQVLQNGILAIMRGLGGNQNYLVSGGVVLAQGGNTFGIQAGVVCLNGRFVAFDSQTVTIVTTIRCWLVEEDQGIRPFFISNNNRPGWKKYSVAFGTTSPSGAPFVEVGRMGFLRRLDHLFDPIGTLKHFDGSSLTGNFDSSGLGIGDWRYWAICNGQNGTEDMSGRVLAMDAPGGDTAWKQNKGAMSITLNDSQVGRGGTLGRNLFQPGPGSGIISIDEDGIFQQLENPSILGTSGDLYKIRPEIARTSIDIRQPTRYVKIVQKIV